MKKKVGTLNGKPIVYGGDQNLDNINEIRLVNSEGGGTNKITIELYSSEILASPTESKTLTLKMNKLPTFPKFDVPNHREDSETHILNYIKDLNIEFVIRVNYATPYYGTMVLRSNAVDIMMKSFEEASALAISSAIQADIYRNKRITIQNFALTGSLGFNNITGNLIPSPDGGILYDFKLICNIQSGPV